MPGVRFLLVGMALLIACQPKPSARKLLDDMQVLIEEVANREIGAPIDTARVEGLMDRARQLAQDQPADSLAPEAFFQAAELARSIGRYPEAVDMLRLIEDEYPQYGKAAEALFLRAFIYDQDLRNNEKALEGYRAFVRQYTDHPLARDAQVMITYLETGKTPEQLIREFEAQEKVELE